MQGCGAVGNGSSYLKNDRSTCGYSRTAQLWSYSRPKSQLNPCIEPNGAQALVRSGVYAHADSPLCLPVVYGNAGVYREGDYMYDGEFFEDVITGYGTFRYASGSTYSGEWKSGKYHGKVRTEESPTCSRQEQVCCA